MVKWITAHTIAPRPFDKKQRPRQQPPQCPLRIKRWSSWIFRHFCVVRRINSERVGVGPRCALGGGYAAPPVNGCLFVAKRAFLSANTWRSSGFFDQIVV